LKNKCTLLLFVSEGIVGLELQSERNKKKHPTTLLMELDEMNDEI